MWLRPNEARGQRRATAPFTGRRVLAVTAMTLRIDHVTQHGMGRAGDVLIPRTLPGEEVDLLADGSARIVTPSVLRVTPPCRHYGQCGGCAMQHAADGFVADWKAGIVARALAGQGVSALIAGVVTSPGQSRRRAKLAGRRTKAGALVGFHARASDQIVAVPGCILLVAQLQALIPALHDLTMIAASRSSEIALTVTESRSGPDVRVEGGRALTPELRRDLADWATGAGVARLVWGTDPVALRAAPVQRIGRADVVPPPGAFLQATASGEAALRELVLSGTAGAGRVADLFAGCGTFALSLAERTEVHAVESDAAMLDALARGWRGAYGLRRLTTETRDLFRRPLLPQELNRFDAVVIDPPRAGAEAQIHEIARSTLSVVVMVSCNPVTFARDARLLVEGGYRIGPVTVVDQFRWSAHVELASRFTRAYGGGA